MGGGALAGVGAEAWAGDVAGVGAEVWAAWAGEVDIGAGAESISKWRTEFVPSATFFNVRAAVDRALPSLVHSTF